MNKVVLRKKVSSDKTLAAFCNCSCNYCSCSRAKYSAGNNTSTGSGNSARNS